MHNMKSVMIFDPKDSDEQTANKWINWTRDNNINRVPNAEETREYLGRYKKSINEVK